MRGAGHWRYPELAVGPLLALLGGLARTHGRYNGLLLAQLHAFTSYKGWGLGSVDPPLTLSGSLAGADAFVGRRSTLQRSVLVKRMREDRMQTNGKRHARENRFIAMSHPVRREVLRILDERLASPVEIGRELDLPTPNIAHHVKRLVDLDCAELVEERKVQGAIQHMYRATEYTLVSMEEWDELHPEEAARFVAEIMQMILNDYLASERAEIIGRDSDFHLTRTPVLVDLEGLREGIQLMERVRLEVEEIVQRSAERGLEQGTELFPASSSLGLFKVPAGK